MRRKAPKRFTAHFRKKVCRVSVIPALDDRNSDRRCLNYGNQAYLSAQEAARPEGPRLPQENGYRQRPQGPGSSPRKGPRPSVLLSKTDARETLEQRSLRDGGRCIDPSVPIRVLFEFGYQCVIKGFAYEKIGHVKGKS